MYPAENQCVFVQCRALLIVKFHLQNLFKFLLEFLSESVI